MLDIEVDARDKLIKHSLRWSKDPLYYRPIRPLYWLTWILWILDSKKDNLDPKDE